jgi:hypothetical protein
MPQFESGPVVFGMSTALWTGGGPAVVVEDDSPKTPKKPIPNATVMTSKVTITPITILISFLGHRSYASRANISSIFQT